MPEKKIDPVKNPREAEKSSDNVPNEDPNVNRDPSQPNDSTTGSQPETPGSGTEHRTETDTHDDDSPKADGNATRNPGGKEVTKPGEETAPLDRS